MTRPVLHLLVLGSIFALGCSDDSASPERGGRIRGAIRLEAPATDEIGTVIGEQRVTDMSGATVRLMQGDRAVETQTSVAGKFAFEGVLPGSYRVDLVMTAASIVSSRAIELDEGDSVVLDTLVVGLPEGLVTYPNPFPRGHGVGLEFVVPAAPAGAEVRALTTSVRAFLADGSPVWRYTFEAPPGFQHIHWAGHDSTFVDLPAGVYWVSVEWPGTVLATFAINDG